MSVLNEIMTNYGSDKASWAHGYCEHYESFFESIKDEPVILLEVGIGGEDKELGGASLKGWADYFPNSKIYGIDIYDKHELDSDRITTFWGSQVDKEFMESVINQTGAPDIIIDDASHINSYTIDTFKILFPLLKRDGLYIVEDLSCSYRWDFGGFKELKDMQMVTIMNFLFSMLHNLNPVRIGDAEYKDMSEFEGVESVHFYPDMVIIKKL